MACTWSFVQYKFQSLMGFPMRCDIVMSSGHDSSDICFNPLWVFQCAVTRCIVTCLSESGSQFQSLMGFPMRCDLTSSYQMNNLIISFNPLWVFQCAVTIYPCMLPYVIKICFNPLWVFQCAVTLIMVYQITIAQNSFQSLMGFPMRCDFHT